MINLNIELAGGLKLTYYSQKHPFLFARCTNPYTNESYLRTLYPGVTGYIRIHYFCPWRIELFDPLNTYIDITLNYENCIAGFLFASSALGDTLAWVPLINDWAERNNVQKIYVKTNWNFLFDKNEYPKIVWLEDSDQFLNIPGLRLIHTVGHAPNPEILKNKRLNHATAVNWQETNMFDSQNYSLGLPSQEIKPKLTQLPPERLINKPYVTICKEASQKIKHILNPQAWLALSYRLKELGYEVVSVGNQPSIIPEVVNSNGTSFDKVMRLIRDAEFHIGVSSGLSWLAWAYNKHVLMLGNFTHPGYEFSSKVVRVIDQSLSWGLFNDPHTPWVPEWQFDPENDNVQIARRISAAHALKGLDTLISLKKSNSMEGLYITEDFQLHKIEKLQPKEFPDYLTKT